LLFPAASVKAPDATSTVTAPAAEGVKVAVYTVEETAEKLLSVALVTEISSTAKFEVASLEVNVSDSVASSEASPSDTSAAVIVMVGAVESTVVKLNAVVLEMPA